jgi:hypothetical protein
MPNGNIRNMPQGAYLMVKDVVPSCNNKFPHWFHHFKRKTLKLSQKKVKLFPVSQGHLPPVAREAPETLCPSRAPLGACIHGGCDGARKGRVSGREIAGVPSRQHQDRSQHA